MARVILACTVAAGTRNARAISSLVRPPTTRRVSATLASRDSTGWQEMNISASTSSSILSGSHSRSAPSLSGRRARSRGGAALAQVAGEGGVPLVEGGAAAERVDRAAAADGKQPPGRVAGHAVARPGHQGLRERLLCEVLGQREIAGVPGERTDDPRGLDPPHGGDRLPAGGSAIPAHSRKKRHAHSWPVASRHARSFLIQSLSCGNSSIVVTRRISVLKPGPLIGNRLAHSTASSFDATLRM